MKIGIDIDDTTVPLVPDYYRYAVENFGYYSGKSLSDFTDYSHTAVCSLSEDEVRACFRKFYLTPEFASLMPYPNAVKAVRQLLSNGEKIYFITSRDESTYPQTKKQLEIIDSRFGLGDIHFAKHTYNGESLSKEDIAKGLGIEHFVDDFQDHVKRVSAKGIHSILFDMPWNREFRLPKNAERAYSWPHVMAAIYDEEKFFRYLVKHPAANVLPLYTFKAVKRKKLLVPPSGYRYTELQRGNEKDETIMDLSIDGGRWSDLLLSAGIASSLYFGANIICNAQQGLINNPFSELSSLPHRIISEATEHMTFR